MELGGHCLTDGCFEEKMTDQGNQISTKVNYESQKVSLAEYKDYKESINQSGHNLSRVGMSFKRRKILSSGKSFIP